MATRQYIGARYVPIFAGPVEWDNKRTYEPLTIVTQNGNSFTSKQTVPPGIDIMNTEYWVATGNFNAQVEQYRKEVREAQEEFAKLSPEQIHQYENELVAALQDMGELNEKVDLHIADTNASITRLDADNVLQDSRLDDIDSEILDLKSKVGGDVFSCSWSPSGVSKGYGDRFGVGNLKVIYTEMPYFTTGQPEKKSKKFVYTIVGKLTRESVDKENAVKETPTVQKPFDIAKIEIPAGFNLGTVTQYGYGEVGSSIGGPWYPVGYMYHNEGPIQYRLPVCIHSIYGNGNHLAICGDVENAITGEVINDESLIMNKAGSADWHINITF